MEKLTFGYGISSDSAEAPRQVKTHADGSGAPPPPLTAPEPRREREKRDWAYIGLMIFTGLLYFRPQDMITPLRAVPMAELSAIFALIALGMGRLSRGLPVTRITPELVGVLAFATVILFTAPFSIWVGGAVGTFTDMYAKVVLIFLLMVNTLTTPKRIEQFTWVLVIASGYIAGRAVLDYARGINLIENGRVQGAVGGMFGNPNDLALNLVVIVPLAFRLALGRYAPLYRGIAALFGVLMLAATVFTQSRAGFVGLAAMVLVLAVFLVRRKPGLVFAGALAVLLVIPVLPDSYYQRIASITNEELDQTGSREARSDLLKEAFEAFKDEPFTGVGAGQFKNYNPEGREQPWREAHNVVLQVASEIGIGGVLVWAYLFGRSAYAPVQTRRLLRLLRTTPRRSARGHAASPLSPEETEMFTTHAAALSAAICGWFVCGMFASVAYHWTFYYLLALAAAPRDYLMTRMTATRSAQRLAAARGPATAAEAHA